MTDKKEDFYLNGLTQIYKKYKDRLNSLKFFEGKKEPYQKGVLEGKEKELTVVLLDIADLIIEGQKSF